jgi:hypothetical protein
MRLINGLRDGTAVVCRPVPRAATLAVITFFKERAFIPRLQPPLRAGFRAGTDNAHIWNRAASRSVGALHWVWLGGPCEGHTGRADAAQLQASPSLQFSYYLRNESRTAVNYAPLNERLEHVAFCDDSTGVDRAAIRCLASERKPHSASELASACRRRLWIRCLDRLPFQQMNRINAN